jgi:hypothetical protein
MRGGSELGAKRRKEEGRAYVLVEVTPRDLGDPSSESIPSALVGLQLVAAKLGGQAEAVTGRDEAGGEVGRNVGRSVERDVVATGSVLADLRVLLGVLGLLCARVEGRLEEGLFADLGLEEAAHDLWERREQVKISFSASTLRVGHNRRAALQSRDRRPPRRTETPTARNLAHLVANSLSNRPKMLHVLLILLLKRPSFNLLGNLVLEHGLENRVLPRRLVVGLNSSSVVEVGKRVGGDLGAPVAVPRRVDRVGLVLLLLKAGKSARLPRAEK